MNNYSYFFIGFVLVILLVVGSIVQISVSNNLTTQGTKLAKIQEQTDALKKENMIVAEQLYMLSSYTHIASQAATLGFVPAKSAIYLSSDAMPLAIKP